MEASTGKCNNLKKHIMKISSISPRYWAIGFLIAIFVIALSSCSYEKRLNKWCARCAVKDSISYKEVIKIKDTTIYITKDGPIQYLENPCKTLCDSLGNLKPFEIKKKENGIIGTIKSVGNSIAFDCKADSLEAIIKGLREKEITKSETKTVIVKENYVTGWQNFLIWCGKISLILFVVILFYLIIKYYKKFHLP